MSRWGWLLVALLCTGCSQSLVVFLADETPDDQSSQVIVLSAPNGDEVSYQYEWFVDGERSDWEGSVLPPWQTRWQQEWSVWVTGTVDGINTEPGFAQTVITDAGTATDHDGDGWSADGGDCDDDDIAINPGASDFADTLLVDDNCNGFIDEGSSEDHDILLTEVMPWPSQTGAGWLEVQNVVDRPLDLRFLYVEVNDQWWVPQLTESVVVQPDALAVICEDPVIAQAEGVPCANVTALATVKGFVETGSRIALHFGMLSMSGWLDMSDAPSLEGRAFQVDAATSGALPAHYDSTNWCPAAEGWDGGDKGSPGVLNPGC
jgi:hypothetical protein